MINFNYGYLIGSPIATVLCNFNLGVEKQSYPHRLEDSA